MRRGTLGRRAATNARAAALVLLASTYSLSGCGGDSEVGSVGATEQRLVTASSSAPAATEPEYDTTYKTVKPTYGSAAVDKYGQKSVERATTAVIDFTMDHSFDQTMMTSDLGANRDAVLALTKDMTPDASQDWTNAVNDYIQHGKEAKSGGLVMSLTLYAAWSAKKNDDMTVAPEGPGAVNPALKSVQTSLQTDGRLQVHVKSSADVRLVVDKKPVRMKIERDQTFWTEKTSDGWMIDGWTGSLKAGQYRPEVGR